jgi:hypothetical protein
VINNYTICATDLRPKGFKVIEFDDYISDKTIRDTLRILDDSAYQAQMCNFNYALA